jgi:hypothetical protein
VVRRSPSPASPQELADAEKAVSKHINNMFTKLDLYPAGDDNRPALFHGRNDRYEQDRYGEYQEDEMRAIKIVSYGLSSALPAGMPLMP